MLAFPSLLSNAGVAVVDQDRQASAVVKVLLLLLWLLLSTRTGLHTSCQCLYWVLAQALE